MAKYKVSLADIYMSKNILMKSQACLLGINLFEGLVNSTRLTTIRYFTQKKATSYGLTGWVKNTSNSKVLIAPLLLPS